MYRVSPAAVVCSVLLALPAPAADPPSAKVGTCDLAQQFGLGPEDREALLRFDRDLRTALASETSDPAALSLLVVFPLRVVDRKGSVLIADPATLRARLDEVFPRSMREDLARDSVSELWCRHEGIFYPRANIWVHVVRPAGGPALFRVGSVHKPRADALPSLFSCQTAAVRLVVDAQAGVPQLRTWPRTRPLGEPPGGTVAGEERLEGSPPCAARTWTFATDSGPLRVRETGCDSAAPPGARGSLTSGSGEREVPEWCF